MKVMLDTNILVSAFDSDGEVLVNPFSFENSKKGFDLFISKFKNFDLDNQLIIKLWQ